MTGWIETSCFGLFGKKSFGDRWISWMKGCVMDPFFSIMINGTSKGFFKVTRGLRQCNPLSHFLFSLVTDGLCAILTKTKEASLLEGFVIGENRIMVSHLQFANDIILFLKADLENIKRVDLV